MIYLRRQIRLQQVQADLQRDQYEQENRQKMKAALIRVPHALVEVHDYLVGCYEAWKEKKPDDRPKPPFSALEMIMDAAAHVDDPSFESFRRLVICAQNFETRIASPGRQRDHNTLSVMIADLAEYAYLRTRLFGFARMEPGAETIPYVKPTCADLEEALDRVFDLADDDQIRERIARAMRQRFPGEKITPSDVGPLVRKR